MPMLLPHRRRAADRALSGLLRLLLAGVLCLPLLAALYAVHVWWQVSSVGFVDDCLPAPAGAQQPCLWASAGLLDLSWDGTAGCNHWHVSYRPC